MQKNHNKYENFIINNNTYGIYRLWKSTSKNRKRDETENKENDDVVQNEQIADTGSYPPCVMVDGVIYKDTGYVASMPGCGTMDGEIVSTVAGTELPSENNQSNFGSGYHYQRSSEGQLIVVIDDERIIFRDIEKDDTSIPIEVINFNRK